MDLQLPDTRVFEWLGTDSKGVPYYLHPLNLVWSNEGSDHDIGIYRCTAEKLAKEPAYWAAIIRTAGWRHSLVGCICLLASGRRGYFDELCFRFHEGSFVVPQIAVTLGLLHRVAAQPFFESVLNDPKWKKYPKQVVSADRMLVRLGVKATYDISVDAWPLLEQEDALVADHVVSKHWDFWKVRLPDR